MSPRRASLRSSSVERGVGASVGTEFTLGGLWSALAGTAKRGAPGLKAPVLAFSAAGADSAVSAGTASSLAHPASASPTATVRAMTGMREVTAEDFSFLLFIIILRFNSNIET